MRESGADSGVTGKFALLKQMAAMSYEGFK